MLTLWLAAVVAALGQGERSGVSLPAGIQHRWVGPGEAVLLALPFEPYDDSLAALLAGARLERLHRWDPLNLRYAEYTLGRDGTVACDGVPGPATLGAGEAFAILNEEGAGRQLFFGGAVCLATGAPVRLERSYNMVGSPYAVPLPLGRGAGNDLPAGTALAEAVPQLYPGTGYWVLSSNEEASAWTLRRPFSGSFETNALSPRIRGVRLESVDTLDVVHLEIGCTGEAGERLAVYYRDNPEPGARLDLNGEWQLAESGLASEGRTVVEWTDGGAWAAEAGGVVDTRLYVVVASVAEEPQAESGLVVLGSGATGSGVGSDPGRGTVASGQIIYVDQLRGDDGNTGELDAAVTRVVNAGKGPKKSIRAGLGEVRAGGVLVIREGLYREGLDLGGRGITVMVKGRVVP